MQLGAPPTRPSSGCRITARRAGGVLYPGRISRLRSSTRPTLTSALGPGGGGGKGPEDALRKLAQKAERHANYIIDCLTPKQEYDFADVTLILVSTLVFMWLAACTYRLYAYCFFASGHQTLGVFFGGH